MPRGQESRRPGRRRGPPPGRRPPAPESDGRRPRGGPPVRLRPPRRTKGPTLTSALESRPTTHPGVSVLPWCVWRTVSTPSYTQPPTPAPSLPLPDGAQSQPSGTPGSSVKYGSASHPGAIGPPSLWEDPHLSSQSGRPRVSLALPGPSRRGSLPDSQRPWKGSAPDTPPPVRDATGEWVTGSVGRRVPRKDAPRPDSDRSPAKCRGHRP